MYHFSVRRDNTPPTPGMMPRNVDGKVKLRDRRMLQLKINKRKVSDSSVSNNGGVSPSNAAKKPKRKNVSTPLKVSANVDGAKKFFQARFNDNRIKSPMNMHIRGPSRLKGNQQTAGRNRNMTIDNYSLGHRSPSPHILSPVAKNRKYDANNNITNGK
jgi:hypothetical protein